MKLFTYFRSSAAYRVRIALALKGVDYQSVAVNLVEGAQRSDEYLDRIPQGLVPALEFDNGRILSQSMAILEWLEEAHPTPPLYPQEPLQRAHSRALCQHIACDIHPLNNLRVLSYLREEVQLDKEQVNSWYAHWVTRGFTALEREIANEQYPFSLGDNPGMFEVLLVPQVFNARRFSVPLDAYPHLLARAQRCESLPAFANASPDAQPDAPKNVE